MSAVLESIKIEKERYGKRQGKYTCEVMVKTANSKIYMDVSDRFIDSILKKCASELINEFNRGAFEFTNDLAIEAGLEIDESALKPESGAFRMLEVPK